MATTTTTSGGTVTSLSNTPQAQDDIFTTGVIGTSTAAITEDLLGVVYLDVMSNDLGGSAKTLWSLDDATSLSTATKIYAPADLLIQDTGRIEATSTDTSFNGAKIWITSDGKVGYDAATLSTAFKAQLQSLAAGGSLTDTFTYAIRLGNGTLSWATAKVQFAGVNDSVTMSIAVQAGTVTEDATTTPSPTDSLSTSGTIAFSDVDLSDTHTASFVAAGGNATALGNFTLASVTEAANAADGTVNWTYTLDNATAQYLAQGQTVTETYVVTISDGHGSSTTQNVTISITGTNDQVQITSGVQAGDAGEDSGDYAASGSITFTDVDLIDTHSVTVTPGASGYLGSFTTHPLSDSTGTGSGSLGWNFAVNNAALQFLGEGQSVTQTYNVVIGDGAVQTVTITITGTNDQPTLTIVDTTGAMNEGNGTATLSDSGALSFADLDSTDTVTVSQTANNDIVWSGGVLNAGVASALVAGFSVDQNSWDYSSNQNLDFLGAGETITFSYAVVATDDSGAANAASATQTVTITITGSNDAPVLSFATGNDAGAVQEDTTLTVSGQFSSADIDHAATATWTINGSSTGTYGSIAVDNSGQWTYTLANGTDGVASAVQSLQAGESHDEVFSVQVSDGLGGVDTHLVTVTVSGSNDAPVLTVETSGAVSEDAAAPTLTDNGTLSFTDVDVNDGHIVSAAYNGDASWTDGSLSAGQITAITSGFSADSNSWDYSVANSALQFLGTGESITLSFNVTVTDYSGAGNASDTETVTITITGSNDQPTLTIADTSGAMNEGNGTVTLSDSGALSFADLDSTDTVTVSQSSNNDITWSNGTLNAGVASALVAGFSVDQDSWDYSSNQNLDFLGAGETIAFSYTVVATDDSGAANATSATQIVTITLTGTNDQPILTMADTTGAMNEGNGTATLNDSGALSLSDLDSTDTVTVSHTANNDIAWSGGTLNVGVASALVAGFSVDQNSWDYSSNENLDFLGEGETISFSYTVVATDDSSAANAASATQTVTITITGSNDAPVLSFTTGNEAGAVQEDTTLTVSGQFSSTDIDHAATAAWTINGSATGSYGSIAVDSSGQWTYTLANGTDGVASAVQSLQAGESHDEVFSVQVSDGLGGVDTQLVTVTVSGTNDAPVLSFVTGNDTGAVQEDSTLSVSGQFSSADIDHAATATWSIAGSNTGTYGSIAVDSSGQWTYTLANGTDGVASAVQSLQAGESHDEVFSVQVSDGLGGVDTQLVTVTVSGTNDAAVLSSASVTLTETNAPLTTNGILTVSDIDSPESFQAQTNIAGSYGQFSIGTNGAWTYVADSAHNEFVAGTTYTDTFAVSSVDGTLTSVTVQILGTNDAAVLSADIAHLTETDAAVDISTTGSLTISDVDSAATFVTQTNTAGSYGQFSIGTGGAWSYVADSAHNEFVAGTTYTDTFAVSSADGTVTSVTVHIAGSNDTAVLSSANVTLTETNSPLTTNGTLTISDVDNPETFQAQSGTAGANGTFAIDAAGNWSYIANSAFNALNVGNSLTDTFTVLSADGTATAVTVTINGSNDAPTITSNGGGATASVSVAENTTAVSTVVATDVDLPAQTLSYSIVGGADAAKFSIVSGTGALSFISAPNFESPTDSGTNNVYDVIVRASDGTLFDDQALAISVTGVNDNSPVITSNGGGATASVNVAENTSAVTTVVATDADLPAQTLSYSILNTSGTDFSKFSISSSGVLTFNSAPDYENAQDVGGADGDNAYVVDVQVADGNGRTDTQTITVNVQNVVETPVDTVAPTVSVTGTALGSSIGSTSTVTFQFSEAVIGFNLSDVTVSASGPTPRATWSNFTQVDGDTYTATLTRTLGGSVKVDVTANSYTDLAGNAGAAGSSANLPAGVAGEPINLALTTPSTDVSGPITVSISGVPSGWIFSAGTDNGDGTWTVQTSDPGALTVTTPSDFAGALVLDVNMNWSNSDGSTASAYVFNNIEVYAPGAPIFALSADDNLTGSSGADTFVFAQPIGNNQIYSFDVTADKIDLIGFTGITGFADLSITNDANGNAQVSISSGQSVTLKGVDAANLSEANFQFDVDPVMTNTGTLTIADGAIMPFGGSIHNSGTIELGSTGSETNLEILFRGATLTGGGQVQLSDSAQNVIFGGSADTVLTNVDNRISGAGQLGAGQMVLVNAGLILASGLNSLVLDTGTHTITNSGVLESTGEGGMTVVSAVDNSGHLWANGGDMRLLADVMGNGSATIDGDATLTFSGAAHGSVAFHGEGAGTLVIAQAEAAGSLVGILGLESDDMLTFGDLAFGANTQLTYSTNASGAGGLLTVDDGVHRAEVNLLGHYTVDDFQATDGGEAGTQISYNGASSGTLVGSMAADVLSGGDGNDILAGRGGEDTLSGGAGADMFAYLNVAEGGDTILDYNFAEGDALDLSALLSANFVSGVSQASDFVQLAQSGNDITVKVDADGAANGTNFADVAVLANTGTSGTDLVRTWFGEADHTLTA